MEHNTTPPTVDQPNNTSAESTNNVRSIPIRAKRRPMDERTEKIYYFLGLPGWPELLARSNDHMPWVEKESKCNHYQPPTVGQLMRPVGDHLIVDAWNKGMSGGLVPDIVEALQGIQWDTVDVLRMCYPNVESTPVVTKEERVGTVKAHITVPNNSIPSPDALRVAKECKAILVRHGINDVECEVMQYREPAPTPRESMYTYWQPVTEESGRVVLSQSSLSRRLEFGGHDFQLEDALGTSISFIYGDKGSKCLYLDLSRDGEPTKRVALTLRSVAVPSFQVEITEEFRQETSKVQVPIIQPTDDWQKLRNWEVNVTIGERRRQIDSLNQEIKTLHLKEHEADDLEALVKKVREITEEVREATEELEQIGVLDNPATRIIGHTLYAPPMKPAGSDPSNIQSDWMRDWALLELDSTKHARKLSELSNEGVLFHKYPAKIDLPLSTDRLSDGLRGASIEGKPLATMPLRGVVPETEIWARQPQPGLLVGSFSASTGLSYGLSNNVKSLRRHLAGESEHILEEWAILHLPRLGHEIHPFNPVFLNKSDRGACIFDANTGRVAGMLTSNPVQNVAYATPMERLLRDIRDSGFNVSIPETTEEQGWLIANAFPGRDDELADELSDSDSEPGSEPESEPDNELDDELDER